MKKKIYWTICLAALAAMAAAFLCSALLFSLEMQSVTRRTVRTEMGVLASSVEQLGAEYLEGLTVFGDGTKARRVTLIAADGTVIYDSCADPAQMENHADREEVIAAQKYGKGESTRFSDTLEEKTCYLASRLSDGSVIRVASTMKSEMAAMADTIPLMFVMAALIFFVTVLAARLRTERIIAPINAIDPDDPQADAVYDELAPLVRRLQKQKETIREQMQALRQKQDEFTAITENMKEGFIVVDSRAEVVSYNTSAVRILETEKEMEAGESVNIITLNRSQSLRQVVDTALAGEHSEQDLEIRGRCYQIIANPVAVGRGRHGAVVVILDVTEMKNREELRREFTANVSHELKTPLTSISGYAEIMKNGLVQPEDMSRFSEKIYDEAQRLISLVGDILKLSRLEEQQISGEELSQVDLCQIAGSVVERMTDVAAGAQVSIRLLGYQVTVHGSERVLDEMIFNLCDNAVKYNRPGGSVLVQVGIENGRPFVLVEDTGIGIPKEDQERIFERFYRVDKSRSRKIGGTGLGLSIVKHGAAMHRAAVQMESTPGVGTKVKIVFGGL